MQVLLNLISHSGAAFPEQLVEFAGVPRVGEVLWLKNMPGLQLPDNETDHPRWLVWSVEWVWHEPAGTIVPKIDTEYLSVMPANDPQCPTNRHDVLEREGWH